MLDVAAGESQAVDAPVARCPGLTKQSWKASHMTSSFLQFRINVGAGRPGLRLSGYEQVLLYFYVLYANYDGVVHSVCHMYIRTHNPENALTWLAWTTRSISDVSLMSIIARKG